MIINRRGNSDCETAVNCFKNDCTGSKFSIEILEKLPGNSYRNGAVANAWAYVTASETTHLLIDPFV